jgi:hypothetical protein
MRTFSLSLLFIVAFSAGILHGCGGSPAMKAATPKCVLASQCTGNLVCALGFCVSACEQSKDCLPASAGLLCVKSDVGNACRAPEAAKGCVQNSDCKKLCSDTATVCPVVCGRDLQCRTQCVDDVDCLRGQKCTVGGSCADLILDKAIYDPKTNDFILPTTGAGGSTGTAGTTGTGGVTGAAGDMGAAGTTGAAGSTADGGAGTTGAAGSNADAGNPDVAQAVDGVMVTPNASVRQGQISITITITKAAGGLSNASVVDFGGLKGTVQDTSTDTSLVIKVQVPHGQAIGKATLKVSTKGGQVTAADVLDVTAITAGPAGMDTNPGSGASPYRSLKQAVGVADVGDTIHLLDGKYSIATSAETWGYVIPENLTVVGDTTAGTIIDGVGATTSPDGFAVSKALTLKTLTLQHFRYGLDLQTPSSTLTLQDVYVGGNSSHGIYVEALATGSTVTISGKNGLIDQPGLTGIEVYNAPNITVNLTDGTVQGGGEVIQFYYNCSGSKLNISGTTIKQLGMYPGAISMPVTTNAVGTTVTIDKATITGAMNFADAKGSVTITASTITQKYGNAIEFAGLSLSMTGTSITMIANNEGISYTGGQATMSLKNVTITGGSYNIHQSGAGSTAVLRGTTLKTPYYHGYYLQAGDLDLGTATASGDNVLGDSVNAVSYYSLYIGRAAGAASGNPVTSSGTAYGAAGKVPTAQTVDASGGAIGTPPGLYYLTVGNKLIFF